MPMASNATQLRLERLIWTLVYGGLLALVLGLAVRGADAVLGHGLAIGGSIVAVAGVVLIFVRARMRDES